MTLALQPGSSSSLPTVDSLLVICGLRIINKFNMCYKEVCSWFDFKSSTLEESKKRAKSKEWLGRQESNERRQKGENNKEWKNIAKKEKNKERKKMERDSKVAEKELLY